MRVSLLFTLLGLATLLANAEGGWFDDLLDKAGKFIGDNCRTDENGEWGCTIKFGKRDEVTSSPASDDDWINTFDCAKFSQNEIPKGIFNRVFDDSDDDKDGKLNKTEAPKYFTVLDIVDECIDSMKKT